MIRTRTLSLSLAATALALAVCHPAQAQLSFTYTSFDPPNNYNPAFGNSAARGISNTGAILGYYADSNGVSLHGYILQNGAYTTLDYPTSGLYTVPNGINSAGVITGYGYDAQGNEVPFIDNHGVFTSPSALGAVDGTYFNSINDAGQVAVAYHDAANIAHGALYNINTQAFTYLPDIPGSAGTYPQDIADDGDIVENYLDANGIDHGVLDHDGILTDLNFPGAVSTHADGINDEGMISGRYFDGTTDHGFVYDDGTWYSLTFPGATDTEVYFGINDSNQIVGSYADQSGVSHSMLVTTVPEPSAAALLAAGGLAGAGLLTRRRAHNRKALC